MVAEATASLLGHEQRARRKPHRDGAVLVRTFRPERCRVPLDERDPCARPGVRRPLAVHTILVSAGELDPELLLPEREHLELASPGAPHPVHLGGSDDLWRRHGRGRDGEEHQESES